MAPRMRPFRDESDYQAMRALLRQALIANGLRQFSWHVNRLDYWRWHVVPLRADFDDFGRFAFLWEDDGELVGFLVPDGPGEAYLNVLPHASSEDLDRGMLSVAEDHLRQLNPGARLEVFGQELNAETYGVCRSDMMLKGQDASHIVHGNSFSEDGHEESRFDYLLANPPFGVEWKKVEDEAAGRPIRLESLPTGNGSSKRTPAGFNSFPTQPS